MEFVPAISLESSTLPTFKIRIHRSYSGPGPWDQGLPYTFMFQIWSHPGSCPENLFCFLFWYDLVFHKGKK